MTSPRFYYGWVCVAVASLAMVATLPGRTMGLGLITEPLLAELNLSRTAFGTINLWATLLGAGFAVVAGRYLDRFGARVVVTALCASLGLVVLGMTRGAGFWTLFLTITLTRAIGQSALSAASIAMVGKWFQRRVDTAMAVYAVLLTIGFMIAIPGMEAAVKQAGWRPAWSGLGWALLVGVGPLTALFTRNTPEELGLQVDGVPGAARTGGEPAAGATLEEALRTPIFWAFALSALIFNTAYSGITLFNESILREQGFTGSPSSPLIVLVFTGLAANFGAGWVASRGSVSRVAAAGMALLAISLLMLPLARTPGWIMGYAAALGIAGGVVTVVFFSCWGRIFGRRHLGRIQGAAQAITVLASAAGPWLFAETHARAGSYAPVFYTLAPVALGLALFCGWVRAPSPAFAVEA